MEVTIVIGTFGRPSWRSLAQRRAIPSAEQLGCPVIHVHGDTLAEARNQGAAQATTEWLCFLDADDELDAGYLAAMATGTADLRGPAVRYVTGSREKLQVWPAQDLRDGNYLVIGTLVRREMFHLAGGFHDWELYEDWDLWQRCHLLGATIETVADAVYVAHVRRASRNRAPERAAKVRIRAAILQANYPDPVASAA